MKPHSRPGAGAVNPAEEAEGWPRNTGENRRSLVWARGHALAHSEVIPRWGDVLLAADEACKPYPINSRAYDDAEAPFVQAYAAAKAADIERHGEAGRDAWHIAWAWALHGHCEECESVG